MAIARSKNDETVKLKPVNIQMIGIRLSINSEAKSYKNCYIFTYRTQTQPLVSANRHKSLRMEKD